MKLLNLVRAAAVGTVVSATIVIPAIKVTFYPDAMKQDHVDMYEACQANPSTTDSYECLGMM